MSNGSQKFGSAHTDQKLRALAKYLDRYTTALKNQPFQRIYFDAFAGTGEIETGRDAPLFAGQEFRTFIDGSVRRSLQFGDRFQWYIFVESNKAKVAHLHALVAEYPNLQQRIRVIQGDANVELKKFCGRGTPRDWRAVVFLDPFGNHVEWETVVALGRTQAVDLWYLFPAGLGVGRQIGRNGTVHYTHGPSLDRIFGTAEWRTTFVETVEEPDLFERIRNRSVKVATPDSITRYMIARMKNEFAGGVLDDWLPLGSRGIHMYSLLFACANPNGKAGELALRLAEGVLRSERGRA